MFKKLSFNCKWFKGEQFKIFELSIGHTCDRLTIIFHFQIAKFIIAVYWGII